MRSDGSRRLAAVDMTQKEKAARIGVSQPTVAMWTSGERVPTKRHREAMRAAFGIPVTSWPNEWPVVRDVIVRTLAMKAPALLAEIVDELEKLGSTLDGDRR